jgi:selenocysteine lyase/cysteine desulfurase
VTAGLTCSTSDGRVVEYANFDHGASTPALQSVKQAVDAASRTYSSVHRGNGYASRVTSAHYEAARDEVAAFVGARDGDHVIFTRNTTDSVNLLARALPRHTTVFVFEAEHHATLLPWDARRTVRLPVPASLRDAELLLEEALAGHGGRNRLVVLSGASNVTGELWPVEGLSRIARRHGARVALDGAQYAPHRRIDLDALGVDYVAFSGHKLYAPFGAGVLVGRADWLDAAKPYLVGGGATRAVTRQGVHWQTGPARHEAGSPNVIGAVALAAACATIARHREAIEQHESRLGARLLAGLRDIPGVETYSIFSEDCERVGVVTFTIEGLDASLVSTVLSAEYGIGVRDGKFCAHPLVDALLEGALDGEGPTTAVRASIGLATTDDHVGRLLEAVAELAEHGPREEYDHVGGYGWVPRGGTRDVAVDRLW